MLIFFKIFFSLYLFVLMSYIDFMHKLIKCISEYYIDCINECFIFIALIRRYGQG